jgi:hypothetical protein
MCYNPEISHQMTTSLALLLNNSSVSLTMEETSRLHQLEHVIEQGLEGFLKTGAALLEIRSSRLYRATHDTFETYCRDRWTLSVSRANHLIAATRVYEHLATDFPQDVQILSNSNEQLFRPLSRLTPELQGPVWELIRRLEAQPDAPVVKQIVAQVRDAIDSG